MPGALTVLTAQRAAGWARHPWRPKYPPTLNLVLQGRVVRSLLAEAPPPPDHVGQGLHWFDLDLSALSLGETGLGRLAVVLGETDEMLPVPLLAETEPVMQLEELLSRNLTRPWVRGLTYHDAMRAGRSDADVVDLLYRDILGRPADLGGLANYLRLLHGGEWTFNDIRRALFSSDECRGLKRNASEAPGAVFSLRLVAQAEPGPGDAVMHLLPADTLARAPATAAVMDEDWSAAASGAGEAAPWPAGDEARVSATGGEFAEGWHWIEGEAGEARRWMAREGSVLNPWPALPVRSVLLHVRETHRNLLPELRCLLDGQVLHPEVEGEPGTAMRIILRPEARVCPGTMLRLEGLNAGSPLEEGINQDPRVLSIAVEEVVFSYAPKAI